MFKQFLPTLVAVILLIITAIFWISSYLKLKEENIVLKSDNLILQEQINKIQEAATLREAEYQKIETNYNKLNEQLEELKDEESKAWLNQSIPSTVDNTIPY